MARLKNNGECLVEMRVYRHDTDNAEADEMTRDTVTIYRAMSSGKILKKTQSTIDYGMGGKPEKYSSNWTVKGKIKSTLNGKQEIFDAMQLWADRLRQKGLCAEIS
jgi:hypothetical protein